MNADDYDTRRTCDFLPSCPDSWLKVLFLTGSWLFKRGRGCQLSTLTALHLTLGTPGGGGTRAHRSVIRWLLVAPGRILLKKGLWFGNALPREEILSQAMINTQAGFQGRLFMMAEICGVQDAVTGLLFHSMGEQCSAGCGACVPLLTTYVSLCNSTHNRVVLSIHPAQHPTRQEITSSTRTTHKVCLL